MSARKRATMRRDKPQVRWWETLDDLEAYLREVGWKPRMGPQRSFQQMRASADRKGWDNDSRTMSRMFAKALDAGATLTSYATCEWNVAGRCKLPRTVAYKIKGERREVIMTVPCRSECDWCLAQRKKRWVNRAIWETRLAPRTWMVTLTLSAENHYRMLLNAVKHAKIAMVDFDRLTPGEQLIRRHQQINPMITRFLKRVRKRSQSRFRYFLVLEAHVSGLPHYHLLLHEISGEPAITKRDIQECWWAGFSNCKLADDRSPRYVCKYLMKSALARVRASGRYGLGEAENPRSRPIGKAVVQSDLPPNNAVMERGTDHAEVQRPRISRPVS